MILVVFMAATVSACQTTDKTAAQLMSNRIAVLPPTNCAPLERMEKQLKGVGEARQAVGVIGTGDVVELLTSDGGATWSLIVVSPSGVACMAFHGRSWSEAPVEQGKSS